MKTIRNSRLSLAVRGALLFALVPAVALAQDDTDEQIKTLDRVEVTGTRIKTSEAEGLVPVQRITREDIDRSGLTSIGDVVQALTGSGSALNTKFNSSGNFGFPPDGGGVGAGSTTADLRHLGSKRVLVLGAGGATRGALLPLAGQGPAVLAVANRSADKAHALRTDFAAHAVLQTGGYADLAGESFDVVINATSAGLSGETLPLPAGLFASGALAYDMVYGKGLTPFLRQAQQAGVTALADGVGMLVEQAAEAFVWWRGVRPATAEVIRRLSVPLV